MNHDIVRVLDFGLQEDVPYLVMDFAPNGTLRQRYPKGIRVPPERTVRVWGVDWSPSGNHIASL